MITRWAGEDGGGGVGKERAIAVSREPAIAPGEEGSRVALSAF